MGIISDFIEFPIISKFSALCENYKLVLATKGDLFDQKRKISASGLQECFCHIEIMSDKKNADYKRLLDNLGCKAENLLMIGRSW